jgi:hypothetical protein
LRSNRHTYPILCKERLPGKASPREISRCKGKANTSLSHKQFLTSSIDDRPTVSQSLAGRVVFQVDKATSQNKELFGNVRKCCKDPDLDSYISLCACGHHEKATQPSRNSLHNSISSQVIAATQLPVKVVPDQNTLTTTAADSVANLTEAVQPYLGRPYKEINCYELLVKGLEGMAIPYAGKDGLFSKLTAMAREKGLPANAFLNGEGIVKAAGSLVLSRSFPRSSNWKQEAEQLYSEMEPLLNKGQILSFSTRKRGHTGIISQQQNQWTFINSGRLDNSLTADSPSWGVGEEVFKREIRNWFKLASTSKESLTVTLGALGQEKVVASYSPQKPVSASKHI